MCAVHAGEWVVYVVFGWIVYGVCGLQVKRFVCSVCGFVCGYKHGDKHKCFLLRNVVLLQILLPDFVLRMWLAARAAGYRFCFTCVVGRGLRAIDFVLGVQLEAGSASWLWSCPRVLFITP